MACRLQESLILAGRIVNVPVDIVRDAWMILF